MNSGQDIPGGSACFFGPLRPKAAVGGAAGPCARAGHPFSHFQASRKLDPQLSLLSGPQNHNPTHRCRHCSPLLAALDFVFAIQAIPTSTTFAIIPESPPPPKSTLSVDSLPVHRQTSHTNQNKRQRLDTFTRSPKLPQRHPQWPLSAFRTLPLRPPPRLPRRRRPTSRTASSRLVSRLRPPRRLRPLPATTRMTSPMLPTSVS